MQLQADQHKLESAGLRVVGISYDSVEVLAGFAAERKITFPLLSDPGSTTMKAFGIFNPEATGKAAGVPYPGTFIIDAQGVVRAKMFLEGYRQRHSTDALIRLAKTVGDPSRE